MQLARLGQYGMNWLAQGQTKVPRPGIEPATYWLLVRHLQCRHLIPALNAWSAGHNTRLHAQLQPSFLDMDPCTISQLNVVLVRKLLCAWFIFDTLSISVCTTSHRQTSGQLVQELNVCTVTTWALAPYGIKPLLCMLQGSEVNLQDLNPSNAEVTLDQSTRMQRLLKNI